MRSRRADVGATYRFRLGRRELSFDEIVQTHRWSPDVPLPTLVNDSGEWSGWVGKSSAIYGMVLNRVLREAFLDKEPIPMLVPEGLTLPRPGGRPSGGGQPDGELSPGALR